MEITEKVGAGEPAGWGIRSLYWQLAAGLAAAALAGVLINLFWGHWGLPQSPENAVEGGARPGGLGMFAAVALPASLALPTLVLVLLSHMLFARGNRKADDLCRRLLRLDAGTYLALPLFVLIPVLWRELGNGFLAMGLCYLGVITFKGGLLVVLLWQGFLEPSSRDEGGLGIKEYTAVFLVCTVVLGLMAAWTNQAVSTASDEVGYLTLAHSMSQHRTFDVKQTVEAREYLDFYWTRWNKALAFSFQEARGALFPILITPFYALGGRLAVLLMFAALMGIMASLLLSWLEKAGLRPHAAAGSVGLLVLSAPVLVLSRQVFPDVPAMLAFVAGLRVLAGLDKKPVWGFLGVLACAAAIGLLKHRLAPLGGGLALAAAVNLLALRLGWRRAALISVCAALAALAAAWLPPSDMWPQGIRWYWQGALKQIHRYAANPWDPVVIFVRGLTVDQNFGIFFAAPVLALALAGLPGGLRKKPALCFHALLPVIAYLAVLCFTRWHQWYGGFACPGRFAVICLPASALFLGLAVQGLNRPWMRLLVMIPAAFGLLNSWVLTLAAYFHYSRPTAVNNVVAALERNLGFKMSHILPTTFAHSPVLNPSIWFIVIASALLAVLIWKKGEQAEKPRPVSANELLAVPLIFGVLAGGFLLFARYNPPHWLEAEQMEHRGGALWAEWAYPPPHMRGWVMFNGNAMGGSLNFPGGPVSLYVKARGNLEGQLVLGIAGKTKELAWPGGEKARTVRFDLPNAPKGTHRLQLTLHTCPTRACSLLVDRLWLASP